MSWTKAAVGGVTAAALGAIVATVWIGARVREETVVANPYEEGLRLTARSVGGERAAVPCDLGAGPCTLGLDGGGAVTLELRPRPLRTMAELEVRARVDVPGRGERGDVAVSFSMVGMHMGTNEVRLVPADGVHAGRAILVRCPSGRRDWIAEVRLGSPDGPARTVRFPLTVEE